MLLLAASLLGITWGFINYIRGRGMIPYASHIVAAFLWADTAIIFAMLACMFSGHYGLILAWLMLGIFIGVLLWEIGTWLWFKGGWGLYFAAYHGQWNEGEVEVPWIDWIGFKLVPWVGAYDIPSNRRRGTICMALRGTYILALFAILAFLLHDASIAWWGLLGLLQGPAYGVMRWLPLVGRSLSEGTKWAEPLIMFIYGTAVGWVLLTHVGGGL